jgi:hypothetical protein
VLVRVKEQVSGSPVEARKRSRNCRLQGNTDGLSKQGKVMERKKTFLVINMKFATS